MSIRTISNPGTSALPCRHLPGFTTHSVSNGMVPNPQSSRRHGAGTRLHSHPHIQVIVVLYCFVLSACASRQANSPYTPQSEQRRDPSRADQLNIQAAALMASDPAKAEARLREALTADLYHGPAHNNLGVLYLKRGDLYSAASEFQWARTLLPGLPDPRMNLALALECAGKTDDAIATYRTALEVYPNHLPTTQALARLQLKSNKTDDSTKAMLEEIAMRGETQQWKDWARVATARLGIGPH